MPHTLTVSAWIIAPTINRPSAISIMLFRPSRSARIPDIGETISANKLVQASLVLVDVLFQTGLVTCDSVEKIKKHAQVMSDLSRVVRGLEDKSLPMDTRVADITPVSSELKS